MVFGTALFLSLCFIGSARNVDEVVQSTGKVIDNLQAKSQQAKARFADASKFEQEQDTIGQSTEQTFDVNLYSDRQQAFSRLAQRAAEKAKQSQLAANGTEELDDAEEAFHKMNNVGDGLDKMEKDFHDKLHDALVSKLNPELKAADMFTTEASHLQRQAHSMMDPLYGWGDDAEGKADSLNDQTNDALSVLEKVARNYRRQISEHSRAAERQVERKLFVGEDRTAIWRKVHREVRAANWHVHAQQQAANAALLGLPVEGRLTLLVTAAVAAVFGASIVAFVKTSYSPQSSRYQILPA